MFNGQDEPGTGCPWVVAGNARARGLYESEGWTDDGVSKLGTIADGVTVAETRYRLRAPGGAPG